MWLRQRNLSPNLELPLTYFHRSLCVHKLHATTQQMQPCRYCTENVVYCLNAFHGGGGGGRADKKWNVTQLGKKPILIWRQKTAPPCSPRLSLSMYRQVQNKKIIYKVMKTEHIKGKILRKVLLIERHELKESLSK